jgi:hypothetical protein
VTELAQERKNASSPFAIGTGRVATPDGAGYHVTRFRFRDKSVSVSTLLLAQLAAQYFFFAAVTLYEPSVRLRTVVTAYAAILTMELGWKLLEPSSRFRFLTSLAAANSICLFFGIRHSSAVVILPLVAVAWLSRQFFTYRGRHLFNPATFSVFWGGVISVYGLGLAGQLVPVSHAFTAVPHFSAIVIVLGAAMAYYGRHLSLVIALVGGFWLLRGFPNASELIIFFFAATDPVTTPRRPHPRFIFGFIAGLITGALWHFTPNEIVKVAGLVVVGAVAPFFRDLPFERITIRFLGRFGSEAFWSTRRMRLAGVLFLLLYAVVIDRAFPFHETEAEVVIVDAATGQPLSGPAVSPLLDKSEVLLTFEGRRMRVFWSTLHRAWSTQYDDVTLPRLDERTVVVAVASLRCRPAARVSEPFIGKVRLELQPKRGRWSRANKYRFYIPVDRQQIARVCGH